MQSPARARIVIGPANYVRRQVQLAMKSCDSQVGNLLDGASAAAL